MEAIAYYLFRSSVWLTGFGLVYLLFLRNERFFLLNRFYLVTGMLISLIFPLFTWHYTVVLPVTPSLEVFQPQMTGVPLSMSKVPIHFPIRMGYGLPMLSVFR